MKLNWATGLVFVLATAEAVGASNWFSKAGKSVTVAAADANSSEAGAPVAACMDILADTSYSIQQMARDRIGTMALGSRYA